MKDECNANAQTLKTPNKISTTDGTNSEETAIEMKCWDKGIKGLKSEKHC
jgi:hypothetical protein